MTKINTRKEQNLTMPELRRQLYYDSTTGQFIRKITNQGGRAGDVAGTKTASGYISIYVNGYNYLGHRLAWFYYYGVWPINLIDHKDQIKHNNWILNLREATNSQNKANNHGYSKTSKLPKGVFLRKNGTIGAQIRFLGKTVHLGHFPSIEKASAAYRASSLKLQKKFSPFARKS